jgi:hypothetical protein
MFLHKEVGAGLLVLFAFALRAQAIQPTPTVTVSVLKARVEAAQKTYEYVARNYMESRPPIGELLYRWSRRWLNAELDLNGQKEDQVAAYQAHLIRMRELEQSTRGRWKNRTVSIEEWTGAQFYRLEAEIWLARARAR